MGNRMYRLMCNAGPPSSCFEGDTLLLSSESAEFENVCSCNEQFCSQMQIVQVPGNHYSMLQRQEDGIPTAVPQAISEYLLLRGYFGPAAQKAVESARQQAAPEGADTPSRLWASG